MNNQKSEPSMDDTTYSMLHLKPSECKPVATVVDNDVEESIIDVALPVGTELFITTQHYQRCEELEAEVQQWWNRE